MKARIQQTSELKGKIKISGSKNATLPIVVLSLFVKKMKLYNVPNITDVKNMLEVLNDVGISYIYNERKHTLFLKKKTLNNLIKTPKASLIRSSYYLLGGLFSFFDYYEIPLPGGCNFTTRPIDYHVEAIKALGGKVEIDDYKLKVTKQQYTPCNITLKTPSLGTTINIILASIISKGITSITNPSKEPEVIDFINACKKAGAKIYVKPNKIIIKGVKKLQSFNHHIIPDRIEAGSYMLLSTCTKSNITIQNINSDHLNEVIEVIKKTNAKVYISTNKIKITQNNTFNKIDLLVGTYPMFPTDLKQIATALFLKGTKTSSIKDLIYPQRISEVSELKKGNADIKIINDVNYITPSTLSKSTYIIKDLRGGFAGVVYSIINKEEVILENFEIIYRGYEDIINKLNRINIKVFVE